jgi:AmmeMemoRadiSam system protein B
MKPHSRSLETPPPEAVRKAAVAGMFYPASPQALQQTVDDLLAQTRIENSPQELIALLAPHAGYVYSGSVAAHAYKLLHGRGPQTVAVIAPSHFKRFPFIALFAGRAYATPLGEVPVAQNLVQELLQRDALFASSWLGHDDRDRRAEHALEVQLPFLQRALPGCVLLPIIMGEQSWEMCEVLGRHLATLAVQHSLLIVASSDLSHYHDAEAAQRLDQHCLDLLLAGETKKLYEAFEQRACEACGAGPLLATMLAAQELRADKIDLLCYNHSGAVSGDFDCVVGYAAVSFGRSRERSS